MASDGVAVGRDGSCERMLRGLNVALLVCCRCVASNLQMPTSQLELAQELDEPIVAAPVAGSRPRAQKRSVNSVGRTFCVVIFDDILQRTVSNLVVMRRSCGERASKYDHVI